MTEAQLTERPPHIAADHVIDFDIYAAIPDDSDFHRVWRDMMDSAPFPVMWTPHNGGHWIALRGDLAETVMSDYERFSNRTVLVPKDTAGEAYRLIPLSLDPPEHRPFRTLLNDNLSPKALLGTDAMIRALTIELIEGFKPKGRCRFIEDFAEHLPIRIFMQIVDLPMADMPKLKHLADQFTRPDGSLSLPDVSRLFREYLNPIISARRGGAGTDMITRMVSGKIDGRDLSDVEAENICIQTLVGGLDTVINLMSVSMSYLAVNPDLRRTLAADPSRIDAALLEMMRRFPLVSSSREVRSDIEWEGVQLKAGEMVMSTTILPALDEAANADAFAFDLDRKARRHTVFGKGSHTCPGAHLARMEMKILLTEWFARIPEFRLATGTKLSFSSGIVAAVNSFELEWDV
jgi:camphor 5-monooxygenase